MSWFAAHAIMYVRFRDGVQTPTPVWENVLLIEAPDGRTAWRLAKERAKQDEGVDDGSFTCDGRPAAWVCAGIRKVTEVSHVRPDDVLGHWDEVSYSELTVRDLAAVEALAAGKAVTVEYDDERPPTEEEKNSIL